MKYLRKILLALLYLLPAVLFFSYYPIISLGTNSSMNFELSLPLIWLVLFDLLSLLELIRQVWTARKKQSNKTLRTTAFAINLPGLSDRRFFLFALFPLYLTISVFWSANPLRGLLTAGVMWLVFFAIFAIIYIFPLIHPPQTLHRNVLISLIISTTLVCIFCFVQSILDLIGLSRENTLLCAGCTYRSFGFPHPSGFAIEPQFMGNLLLAPTLTTLYLLVIRVNPVKHDNCAKKCNGKTTANQPSLSALSREEQTATTEKGPHKDGRPNGILRRMADWRLGLIATFFSTTLFFTFSRGAIYAYAVALIVMIIIFLKRRQFRWSLVTIPIISFLISLGLQGTFSALSPTPETFITGVTKSIHQLSLGAIDLRPQSFMENSNIPVENIPETVEITPENVEKTESNSGKPADNSLENSGKTEQNNPEPSGNPVENSLNSVQNSPATPQSDTAVTPDTALIPSGNEEVYFEGYVPESTIIRLNLNSVAIKTWLNAPYHHGLNLDFGCARWTNDDSTTCLARTEITPTSIIFGVGLGGAGTAMHVAYPNEVTSPKEIVQNEFFSLLLETGLLGIILLIFTLLVAFFPQLFTAKFLDGRVAKISASATTPKNAPEALSHSRPSSYPTFTSKALKTPQNKPLKANTSYFWHHTALPLLAPLIIAYLITLNFFSGLPNALQIYLIPPLLYLIFMSQTPSSPRRKP